MTWHSISLRDASTGPARPPRRSRVPRSLVAAASTRCMTGRGTACTRSRWRSIPTLRESNGSRPATPWASPLQIGSEVRSLGCSIGSRVRLLFSGTAVLGQPARKSFRHAAESEPQHDSIELHRRGWHRRYPLPARKGSTTSTCSRCLLVHPRSSSRRSSHGRLQLPDRFGGVFGGGAHHTGPPDGKPAVVLTGHLCPRHASVLGCTEPPVIFNYQWRLNGTDIVGATQADYRPTTPGAYTCLLTASNTAGSAHPASTPAVTV